MRRNRKRPEKPCQATYIVASEFGSFVNEFDEDMISLSDIPLVMTKKEAEAIVKRFKWYSGEIYVTEAANPRPPAYADVAPASVAKPIERKIIDMAEYRRKRLMK
jgi:hypothetical protein